jgi:hypothetical protein
MKNIKGMILNETKDTVQIITFASANVKTGDMSQIWILNKHMSPVEAKATGEDSKVCFDCTHRVHNTCYVNVGQAPNAVYKAYKAGRYTPLDLRVLKQAIKWKAVRFGAYGEPVLLPLYLVDFIAKHSKGYTGYTHQWHLLQNDDYKDYFMASCDTESDVLQAHAYGWRTFRVQKTGELENKSTKEIDCPNIATGVQCRDCMLCDGAHKAQGKSIVVPVHGTKGKINKFNLVTI